MNLSTLSQLPAEPAPILGKSLRQQREEREAAERAVRPSGPPPMTSAPAGYEVTPQGGLRRKDQPWVVPETKGRVLKLPRTLEELDASEWWEVGNNQERLLRLRGGCNCCTSPPCFNCTEPITQYEAKRLGLIEPTQRDDGPCGVVPSVKDMQCAWYDALARVGTPTAWQAVDGIASDVKSECFRVQGSFNVFYANGITPAGTTPKEQQ